MRVLFIEDDDQISGQALQAMGAAGFTVLRKSNGSDGIAAGLTGRDDLIVLDLGLPDMDGLEVLKRLRREGISTPVLILTARGGWMERVEGLNSGADDYLPKPFQIEELVARMNALARRIADPRAAQGAERRLEIDPDRLVARLDGKPVVLTPKEFRVAGFLLQNRGRVVPAGELIAHLHGSEDAVTVNSVEALIGRLRRKLGDDLIETRRGFGYLLSDG